ncbi:MAG: Asp23/Gls24 family envelope stress response protein, partial [Stackebrandtia sp.]
MTGAVAGATGHSQSAALDPDERGRLSISPLVLRKIAEHTVDLTPGTLPARRTVAGVGLGSAGASAKAFVTGELVD